MTEKTPTPPNRQDPHLDPADDTDEPAFDWMKPAGAGAGTAAAAKGSIPAEKTSPDAGKDQPAASAGTAAPQAGSRADRKAAEAAVEPAPEPQGRGTHFREPLPTSALQVRPPQDEVERRNAERELAANTKPVLPRVMQVLLAVFYPLILLVLAVRAVTSPLFLWVEYNRPGFPGDGYGFSTDDRMTYGSYAVDYLSNWSGPRYLGELVNRSGDALFQDGEVSHMADVKLVILSAFAGGALLILLSIVAIVYLRRRSTGGVRRGLFAGSIVTLVVILGLGTLAALGWQQFFTEFHRIFFANGTWTFALEDTLIRLFPGQFWVDAGIVIGALVLIASVVTLILTWPTRKRRGIAKDVVAKDADSSNADAAEAPSKDSDTGTAVRPDAAPGRARGNSAAL
ncbi:integral membrane protein (TIGR01906 family) [Arthrobacter sp. PvP102]|uniref:TIGR01906 family membrane protein n=1 Tax=unclassified Arthrobacter TaxID=235627 RepID=UPI001AE52A90|nr:MULTISPECIES: TIGR01906 family membrane protein [unclassified Arthrobacter]MBP1234716.1 integral membrane protein (TIGR01906 family) [Arthrobacter sp. PvP103]MBP1235674.1 integral membrane protein (TIGR01906 family) [Arthrobacter sp. PvP102]